jgi:hypothetical protein
MIKEILIGIIGISLGCWFGWTIAKWRVNRYIKLMSKQAVLNLDEKDIQLNKEIDDKHWEVKNKENDDKRNKHRRIRKDGYKQVDSRHIKIESGTNRRESTNEVTPSNELREPIQSDNGQSNDTNESESKPDSETSESGIFVPKRLE